MYFAIIAKDKPASLNIRMESRPAHLDYVRREGCVMVGGPFLSENDDPKPQGSLMIIAVADRTAAENFAAGDPYAQAGLFADVEITPWTPTLGPWIPEDKI